MARPRLPGAASCVRTQGGELSMRSGLRTRMAASAVVALLGAACSGSVGASGSASANGLVPIGAGLRGRSGLKAVVYATGLPTASAFALDARGRLWVATSAATDHAEDGVYLIRGKGAAPVKVIRGLRSPLGLVWDRGTLYVASIGRVDAFRDLLGTRFAERHQILRGPVAGGSNDNLVVAPDGRLVMSVSTSCDDCTPASRWSATVVSFRTDGSDLRRWAKGVRDGFGLTFVRGTDELLVSMNQADDLGVKTPGDWLGIVRRGQDWGFPRCYGQGGRACAGVAHPLAVLDQHAGAGGVAIDGSSAVVAEWALGKVQRVVLNGPGKGTVTPFLRGFKNPLPVLTTPDAGILVGDWTTGRIYLVAAP
jgi:hypothetical protein